MKQFGEILTKTRQSEIAPSNDFYELKLFSAPSMKVRVEYSSLHGEFRGSRMTNRHYETRTSDSTDNFNLLCIIKKIVFDLKKYRSNPGRSALSKESDTKTIATKCIQNIAPTVTNSLEYFFEERRQS